MVQEKRKVRTYKIATTPYEKAMKRANKGTHAIASLVEQWVMAFSNGEPFFVDGVGKKSLPEAVEFLESKYSYTKTSLKAK